MTARPRPHRPKNDSWVWGLFEIACTGAKDRCAACGEPCATEHGHIVPYADIEALTADERDDRFTAYTNQIPLCKPHNGKLGRNVAPDTRLPGFNERFCTAFLKEMRPKLRLRALPDKKGCVLVIEDPNDVAENDLVIDFSSMPDSSTVSEVSHTTKTPLPNQPEAAEILKRLLVYALDEPPGYHGKGNGEWRYVAPRSPSEKQQGELLKIIMRPNVGREVFLGAGLEYLQHGVWIVHHGDHQDGTLTAAWDSWADFIAGFDLWVERRRRTVEREARKKAEDLDHAEKMKLLDLASRVDGIRAVLKLPEGFAPSEEELAYIDELRGGDIVPANAEERSAAIMASARRWQIYCEREEKELNAAKLSAFSALDTLHKRFPGGDEISDLYYEIRAAKDIASVNRLVNDTYVLLQRLTEAGDVDSEPRVDESLGGLIAVGLAGESSHSEALVQGTDGGEGAT